MAGKITQRKKGGKSPASSDNTSGSESDSDSGSDSKKSGKSSGDDEADRAKEKKAEPYNWGALFLLILFTIVPIFTAGQFVYDTIYPEAAHVRRIYDNVYKCYNAVGDVDKINSIDRFIEKYEGREKKLYAQLRAKYGGEFPECDSFRM